MVGTKENISEAYRDKKVGELFLFKQFWLPEQDDQVTPIHYNI